MRTRLLRSIGIAEDTAGSKTAPGPDRLNHYVQDPAMMAEVDRLLSGRTRDIRLRGAVGQAFRDRSWRQTAKIIRAWMLWVVFLDLSTLMLNLFLLPREPALAMLVPGAAIIPAALGVFLVWRRRYSDDLLGWSLTIGMFIILLSVSLMGVVAGGDWLERYLNVMVFVAIAGITIFSVPLRQTLNIAISALALYLFFQLQNGHVDVLSSISAFLFFASGVSATVVARRTMTILAQKAFLLELRDRRRVAELAEANQRLDLLSKTDPLTGVANRRWMTELLDNLWSDAPSEPAGIAMLMCDIDDFKRLNDNGGHAEGDRCLVEVANIISGRLRPLDYVARYGGEEFLVLLPDATEASALAVAERIRQSVAEAALPNPSARALPVITLSIGVAIQDVGNASTPQQLQSQADTALYAAKRAGRNRVMLYQPKAQGTLEKPTPNVA